MHAAKRLTNKRNQFDLLGRHVYVYMQDWIIAEEEEEEEEEEGMGAWLHAFRGWVSECLQKMLLYY